MNASILRQGYCLNIALVDSDLVVKTAPHEIYAISSKSHTPGCDFAYKYKKKKQASPLMLRSALIILVSGGSSFACPEYGQLLEPVQPYQISQASLAYGTGCIYILHKRIHNGEPNVMCDGIHIQVLHRCILAEQGIFVVVVKFAERYGKSLHMHWLRKQFSRLRSKLVSV